ncbi:response regulator transcription factor [Lacticaseibacillus baoqingensis]|uniref:Response regulator transcription factor n=1 Tax=Lacticaseibacillus baoqingensis TaxID=2486013 RepID=A0ABW4EA69_9LACO|nr:response regulator transcription factor [Lacticaseibacillus baoqingensis]
MPQTILLVEDETSLTTFLTSELKFEGYSVIVAADGQAAWQTYQAQSTQLDLVILDWMLPKLDGLEVLRRIRKQSDIPVIMMTARDYVGDKVAGLDNGADDYITKPFEIEELLARVRVCVRRQKTNVHPTYQVADLTLDTKARTVRRGEAIAVLTPREYDLLLALMQHVDAPMTRDELLDAAWGADFEGQVNIVDVYIRYLRQKIDHAGAAPLIHTVRGVGYVLAADWCHAS